MHLFHHFCTSVYQSDRRVHLAPLESPQQTEWCHCHLHTVYHVCALSTVGTSRSLKIWRIGWLRQFVATFSCNRRRNAGGMSSELQCIIMQQISTPRLRFLRRLLCCASRSSIYFIDIICTCDRGTFWQIVCHYNSLMSQKTVTITLPADGVNGCFAMVCVVNVSKFQT